MKLTRLIMSAVAMATVIVAARCTPMQSQAKPDGGTSAVIDRPVLESVHPDSVMLPSGGIAQVVLTGTGFIPGPPGRNTVHFNGAVFRSVAASADGRRIVFNIPDVISRGGGAPPSSLSAGSYSISVETDSGTSDGLTVRVYR